MSLLKSIEHGREHRKPYYRKAQSVSKSCRCRSVMINGGSLMESNLVHMEHLDMESQIRPQQGSSFMLTAQRIDLFKSLAGDGRLDYDRNNTE